MIAVRLLCVLMLALLFTACNQKQKMERKKRPKPPKVNVKLPPVQVLKIPAYKKYYADQSLTVQHFLRNVNTFFKKKTTVLAVTGVIEGLKKCEDNDTGRCTVVPHFYLVDTKGDTRWRLLVVDLPTEKVEALRLGGKFRVEGTLARFSADGHFSSLRGLIRMKSATDLERTPEQLKQEQEERDKKKKGKKKKRKKK